MSDASWSDDAWRAALEEVDGLGLRTPARHSFVYFLRHHGKPPSDLHPTDELWTELYRQGGLGVRQRAEIWNALFAEEAGRRRKSKPSAIGLDAALTLLYQHEINCGVSSFWDGGWDAWIGDDMNGIKSKANFDHLHEVGPWLVAEAHRLYPVAGLMVAA